MWDDFRVKCAAGRSPAPVKLHSVSQLPLLLYLSNLQASGTVQFIYISPRLLLRRSGLCNAGCCASSLWPVLLILPGHALHLLWYIQTHIHRWAMNLKHLVKGLGMPRSICDKKQLRVYFFACAATQAKLIVPLRLTCIYWLQRHTWDHAYRVILQLVTSFYLFRWQ